MKQRYFLQQGQTYGYLTAIEKTGTDKWHAVQWKFMCDCGTEVTRTGSKVARGEFTHCGCRTASYIQRDGWRFVSTDRPKAAARITWRQHFDDGLSFEDFLRISQLPCHYCGTTELTCYRTHKSGEEVFRYNSIDRKDPTLDHSLENVVPACKDCQFNKQSMGYQEFRDWIQRVHSHLFQSAP